MSAIRPGTCAEPGPYDQHCTDYIGHRYACYDAGDDASFTHWMMERGELPPHACDDPTCEGNAAVASHPGGEA